MRRFCLFLALVAHVLTSGQANDVCYAPFSQFLQCLITQAEQKLQSLDTELSSQVQNNIKACFPPQHCDAPNFSQAKVSFFLDSTWTGRVEAVLDLLEGMDPKVQKCMIDYFKGIVSRKIEDCVKQYGPKDVADFEMPPIPGVNSFDVTKLKTICLNRMMVSYQTRACVRKNTNDTAISKLLGCIDGARNSHDNTMCQVRENCRKEKISDAKCLDRFDKVHKAACDCAKAESEKFKQDQMQAFNGWKELKEAVLGGGIERQFKQCHDDNGVKYPEDKVENVKTAVKQAFTDIILKGGIPPEVREVLSVAGTALSDITEQWKGIFCSDCKDEQKSKNYDQDAKKLRERVKKDDDEKKNGQQQQDMKSFSEAIKAIFSGN